MKSGVGIFELLQKQDQRDHLRTIAESIRQLLIEADLECLIGCDRHESIENRMRWCNGYRELSLAPRICTLNLKLSTLR